MRLFLEPEDVWLFRDGRPFTAGSDHRATSLFPPFPSTVQGMLRSYHLTRAPGLDLNNPTAIENLVGTAERWPEGFSLRGPFVAREEGGEVRRYFPLPQDATGGEGRFRALAPQPAPPGVCTSSPCPLLLLEPGPSPKLQGEWWLREDALRCYLQGDEVEAVPGRELYEREARFGIGRDRRTHAAQDGLLYEVEYIRPQPGVGLEVEVEWAAMSCWPAAGVIGAGGERRAARFRQVTPRSGAPVTANPLPALFKLYLATPTYLARGWQAGDWSRFFDGPVELVCAALGRYRSVGGFDLAGRGHKPARRYVPAGSTFFFRSEGGVHLRRDTISDDPAPIGWGQVFVGAWH